jgi:hypothetical protein
VNEDLLVTGDQRFRSRYAALLALATALPSPARGEDALAKLERGEVLVYYEKARTCRTQRIVLKAIVDAPPERVWPLVDRCGDYSSVLPRVERSAELSRRGTHVVCTETIDMPFPYSDVVSVTDSEHRVEGGRWRRSWRLRSGDYAELHGEWVLRPHGRSDRRTLMVYRNCAELKAWVPGWVRRWAQKSKLPEMVKKIRRRLSAGAKGAK